MTSKIRSIVRLADQTITVSDLVAGRMLFAVDPATPTRSAYEELRRRDYRWVPLTGVPIQEYVDQEDLLGAEGLVQDHAREVPEALRLPETSHLTSLIDHLSNHEVAFVEHGDFIVGILTRADIQQPAVGLYAFGLISALEAGLDQLIERYTDGAWECHLTEDRLAAVEGVREARQRVDVDLGLASCLNLDDRLTITRKVDGVWQALDFPSKSRFRGWEKRVKRVRDNLAHGGTILDGVPDLSTALRFLHDLRHRTMCVWDVVEDDPNLVQLQIRSQLQIRTEAGSWEDLDGFRAIRAMGMAIPLFKVTAHNPGGLIESPGENQRRSSHLGARLDELGIPHRSARAGVGNHWEEGFLLWNVDLVTASDVAAEFGQLSLLRLDEQELQVVDARTGELLGSRPLDWAQSRDE